MIVELLDKQREEMWGGYVESNQSSTIYHTLEWKKILENTYGYKPYYLIARNDCDEIEGVLPLFEVRSLIFGNRLVSLPYSHRVSILCKNDGVLNDIIDFAKQLVIERGYGYLEIKHGKDMPVNLVKNDYYIDSTLELVGTLKDIWGGFGKGNVRWGVKKAERAGVVVRRGEGIEDYKAFYRLVLETRKKQGSPPYPFLLFKNIYSLLDKKQLARLYLAYHRGTCVAGSILFFYKSKATYMYTASKKDRKFLRLQPSNILVWDLIKRARKKGYRTFDLGITPPGHKGLLEFKSRWGTKDKKIPYYYYLNRVKDVPNLDPTSLRFRFMRGIWKKVPISVSKRIGPYLLRHLG